MTWLPLLSAAVIGFMFGVALISWYWARRFNEIRRALAAPRIPVRTQEEYQAWVDSVCPPLGGK